MSKLQNDKVLADLFRMGTTYSDPIEVYSGMKIIFRIPKPEELVEISETVAQYVGLESRALVSQIRTLAYAIVEVNGMYLSLPPAEVDELEKKYNRKFTRVDQAAYILSTEFSKFMLEDIDQAFINFQKTVFENFENLKKKSKKPIPKVN